ncbi:MAG: hypothetical protein JO252_01620 [Planctomycetaceae bacterium]|nr:hypothetical protein [Planctomycetaceae bacterium]MBV8557819.1 hypothetical protein [Planctomycetaceae bacterium]MBV8611325.1 hypothetical protein [Singulisphaera sp.]
MPRPHRPRVEPLESRDLPVGFIVPHPIPITSSQSSASVKLTASPSPYQPGEPESLTLTETNTSFHPEVVSTGSGIADFWVTQGDVEVWRQSKDGPHPLGPSSLVGVLAPRQSRTFSAIWDGHFNEAAPPNPAGPFVFHAAVDNQLAMTGVGAAISLAPQASLAVSAATDRPSYRIGQPVRITFTETNTGPTAVGVDVGGPSAVTITRQGIEVWKMSGPMVFPTPALLLQPGQSRQDTIVWPGRFTEHTWLPMTGTFVVHGTLDGTPTSAVFRVER